MSIELKKIKKEIGTGKDRFSHIYYSTGSMWWTHDSKDLEDAQRAANEFRDKLHHRFLKNRNKTRKQLAAGQKAYDSIKKSNIPTDPQGAALYLHGNPKAWLEHIEANIDKIGEEGMEGLLRAHHQNCNNKCFNSIDDYPRQKLGKIIKF